MKNNTKDVFLDTASILFANKGYHATGISEILKQSKAPKGSLYYYFPKGKEQLADEALKKTSLEIFNEITTVINEYENPLDGLKKHLEQIAKKIEQDMFKPTVSISLIALETFSSNEKLRQRCNEIFNKMQQLYLDKFIQIGINEKQAKFLAMTMVILTEGAITLSLTKKDTTPLHLLANNISQLFNNILE